MVRKKNRNSIYWKLKRVLKNWLILDFLYVVYFILEKLIKKKEDNILFVLGYKESFADNIKYLFEFMHAKSERKLMLFVYTRSQFDELQKIYPDNSIYAFSWRGFVCFLKSKIIIISTGLDKLYFFPYFLHPINKTIIQLWHGSLFKRLGYQVNGWEKTKNAKEFQQFSKFIACSTLERFMISSCFNMKIDDIWITNYPRNDRLLDPSQDLTLKHPYLIKKTILYAPTWREEGRDTKFFPFDDFNINVLQEFLEKNDTYLLIRGHREEMDRINNNYNLSLDKIQRIVPADQSIFPETELLLPHIDILITDYSGIYIDFLLLNRPIIFVPYDLEDYSTYRGVLFDYDKFTAGPKVFSQENLLYYLNEYIKDPGKDRELRISLQSVFHDKFNGQACEKINKKIENIY